MLVAQYLGYLLFGHSRGPHSLAQADLVVELVFVVGGLGFLERLELGIPRNRGYQDSIFLHKLPQLVFADLVPGVLLGYVALASVGVVVVYALHQAAFLGVLDCVIDVLLGSVDSEQRLRGLGNWNYAWSILKIHFLYYGGIGGGGLGGGEVGSVF